MCGLPSRHCAAAQPGLRAAKTLSVLRRAEGATDSADTRCVLRGLFFALLRASHMLQQLR
jgi:hypothetical protein